MSHAFLRLKPAKTDEISPEAAQNLYAAFLNFSRRSTMERILWKPGTTLSMELATIEQKTRLYLASPEKLKHYFTSQILSQYPRTLVSEDTIDPLDQVRAGKYSALAWLELTNSYHFPIKTYKLATEANPLAAILGFLGKLSEHEAAHVQILLRGPASPKKLERTIRDSMKFTDSEGKVTTNEYSSLLTTKLQAPLLEVQIRLLFAADTEEVLHAKLSELSGAFGSFTLAESNSFSSKPVQGSRKDALLAKMYERGFYFWQPTLILNLNEIATIFHLPDKSMELVRGIDWGKTIMYESPDNLPVAELCEDEEARRNINFFGSTEWRNREAVFGIKKDDRRRHTYIIGKTGAGKSTMIANMAINDIRNGDGVAVIDPHGDLSEMILHYIPKRRVADVVYLDPTLSSDRAFGLNLFDPDAVDNMDVIASGIVSVFYKLYHYSWGPRLEYILRNVILSLLHMPETTFMDIPKLLTNDAYRSQVIQVLRDKDPVLTAFWQDEFNKMNDKLKTDAISPVLNKVGQFLSAQSIRNILNQRTSSFSFDQVMNEGKILILNLSQGKLGEDTTALMGAMFITKIQLTAMKRVHMPEEDRRDFFLYVDEFQNFATTSFIKILSEARKYRLNLTMANQYIGQVDEDIQKAVFGNVGSLATFVVGASDAELFARELGEPFTAQDLVNLGKYEILMKMAIDGLTCTPFAAKTLPLPSVVNDNKDKIIRACLERYYRKI